MGSSTWRNQNVLSERHPTRSNAIRWTLPFAILYHLEVGLQVLVGIYRLQGVGQMNPVHTVIFCGMEFFSPLVLHAPKDNKGMGSTLWRMVASLLGAWCIRVLGSHPFLLQGRLRIQSLSLPEYPWFGYFSNTGLIICTLAHGCRFSRLCKFFLKRGYM